MYKYISAYVYVSWPHAPTAGYILPGVLRCQLSKQASTAGRIEVYTEAHGARSLEPPLLYTGLSAITKIVLRYM